MPANTEQHKQIADYIRVWPQYALPTHMLSRLIRWLTWSRCKPWKDLLIRLFIRRYQIDLKQARRETVQDYASFNDFFTRHLKPGARHWRLDEAHILSPVDGTISQIGRLQGHSIVQAKGKTYQLDQLLANDTDAIARLTNGIFTTLYLSPRDYHRLHMPVTGKLLRSIYVPGTLFGVGHATTRTVNNLFARNERFISLFQTRLGLMAQIMVGAFFVGSMQTVWLGPITPTKKRQLIIRKYNDTPISLTQGQEFGHFNMGSTVILLFEKDKLIWLDDLNTGAPIQVGQILGKQQP